MANVFVVQAPFQLLGAIEAKHRFPASDNVLVVVYVFPPGAGNSRQLVHALGLETWSRVVEVPHGSPRALCYRMLAQLRSEHAIERVFIGDIGSDVMREAVLALGAEANFLLDDGLVTLLAQEWFLARGSAVISRDSAPYDYEDHPDSLEPAGGARRLRRALIRWWHRVSSPGSARASARIDLFTAFDCEACDGQSVIRHRFEHLARTGPQQDVDAGCVHFYGSSYEGTRGPSREEELAIIKVIKRHYEASGLRFVYRPHRTESAEKIALFQAEAGIEVRSAEMPAEVELVSSSSIPGHIAACTSTVLATLPLIRQFASVTSFRVPDDIEIEDEPVQRYLAVRATTLRLVRASPPGDVAPAFVLTGPEALAPRGADER